MKTELEEFISANREAFYSRTPDPAVLERIRQQLKGSGTKKKEGASVISLLPRWAAAACLVLVASGVTYLALKGEGPQTVAMTPDRTATEAAREMGAPPQTPASLTTAPQTAASAERDAPVEKAVFTAATASPEEEKIDGRKRALFASLADPESPSRRLTAAAQVVAITGLDNDIVDALAKTLNTDPNTNVRLAALDALGRFYREPYVKKKLVAALQKQKDPMVQIALIELLTKMREHSILRQLNRLVSDENTMQAVKDQAYSGIFQLHS
jgi:hypothetical protein